MVVFNFSTIILQFNNSHRPIELLLDAHAVF